MSMSSSPLPIPAADPFLALLSDCDSATTNLLHSTLALSSLTADLVARNNEWVQQVLAQDLVASFRSALLARKTRVLSSAKLLSRNHCKRTVAEFEAVDVSTKQLRVWAAVAAEAVFCSDDIDCAFAALPLLESPRVAQFPAVGVSFVIVQPFKGGLGSVATGDGLLVVSAAGPGLNWFEPHSRNEFSVVLAQADRSVPVWLTTGDVTVDVQFPAGPPVAAGAWVSASAAMRLLSDSEGHSVLSVVYGGLSEDAPEAVLQLSVCGAPVADATGDSDWCVRVPRKRQAVHECAAAGRHVRTLAVVEGGKYGMAVSADEKWLVVGMGNEGTLSVYSLPGGELVRTFGGDGDGPLRFSGQFRLCFAPNGNLIIVDWGNKRLQETTLEGVFVRFIGVGEFGDDHPSCVAVLDDVIAVAVGCDGGTGPRVLLFDFGTGAVTSRFGEVGTAAGQLSEYCTGIRFTPDGNNVVVAESEATRLSVFTTVGVFVRCVGVGVLGEGFKDVLQSVTGEYVVADESINRVCVFSSDGSELVRSWGVKGTGDGQFQDPTAIVAAGQHLYVMDFSTGRVQVFE